MKKIICDRCGIKSEKTVRIQDHRRSCSEGWAEGKGGWYQDYYYIKNICPSCIQGGDEIDTTPIPSRKRIPNSLINWGVIALGIGVLIWFTIYVI